MTAQRVVVTGIGCVTPIGIGIEAMWKAAVGGRSGTGVVTRFDTSKFRSHLAAEVRDFNPLDFLDARRVRRLERYSQFAVAAARMAVEDAGLSVDTVDRERAGVFLGSALGGVSFAEEQHSRYLTSGTRGLDPSLALSVYAGAGSCNIAIEHGFTGPNSTNANSCASGTMAIGDAIEAIRRGAVDLVLAGGAECPISPLCFGSFGIIHAMSTHTERPETASRPFDRERDGFVMGEGAAILLLESEAHAIRRDARVYCEVAGHARTSDAHHLAAPLPSGEQAARCMSLALRDAGLTPDGIDAINAHGSSTYLNDKTETLAMKQAFGERAYKIPISATKSMHGHSLGASGAIEAAISCLALHHSVLPPTINRTNPDPECDLDYVPLTARPMSVRTILSNSFGFGGFNASVILRAWSDERDRA